MFNLFDSKNRWIPALDLQNCRRWISVEEALTSNQIKDLDYPRPEFSTGIFRFLTAILQAIYPVETVDERDEIFDEGFDIQRIRSGLLRLSPAFCLDSETHPYMQLLVPETSEQNFSSNCKKEKSLKTIDQLLLDSPAEKTIEDNLDFFVKREKIRVLCPKCAAAALTTQQMYATQGGRGYASSPTSADALQVLLKFSQEAPLWKNLWLNVVPDWHPIDLEKLENFLPWLQDFSNGLPEFMTERLSEVQSILWACPRVIRLIPEKAENTCDLCGESTEISYKKYFTIPASIKYGTFKSPFIPYRKKIGEDGSPVMFPIRAQDMHVFSEWGHALFGQQQEKLSVEIPLTLSALHESLSIDESLISVNLSGFPMANVRYPRRWYQSDMPFYRISDASQREAVVSMLDTRVLIATDAIKKFASAIKNDEFPEIYHSDQCEASTGMLWRKLEEHYLKSAKNIIKKTRETSLTSEQRLEFFEKWAFLVRSHVIEAFDRINSGVGEGAAGINAAKRRLHFIKDINKITVKKWKAK